MGRNAQKRRLKRDLAHGKKLALRLKLMREHMKKAAPVIKTQTQATGALSLPKS